MGRQTQMNKLTSPELTKQINPENIQLMNDFLEYLRSLKRSEGTIKGYKSDLLIVFTYVLKNCGNKSFIDLKSERLYLSRTG